MVLHPDEKASKYACTRSSSIAVKLSASAIHTHASLSVHVCVSHIFYHAGRKKNTWIRMYTQITCPDQGLIRRRHRTTLHTPRGLEALVSNTRKSPAMATRSCNSPGTVPLETCGRSDRHSVFNHGGGAGRGGEAGRCSGSPRERVRENPEPKVKTWCLGAGLLGSKPHSERRAFARQLERITAFHAEPCSPHAARHPGVFEMVKCRPPFPGCHPCHPPPPESELYLFLTSRPRVVPPGLPKGKPGHARPLRHSPPIPQHRTGMVKELNLCH